MTVRFGRPVTEYQPDGMITTDENEVEYQYSPSEEMYWYKADRLLDREHIELDAVKVMV